MFPIDESAKKPSNKIKKDTPVKIITNWFNKRFPKKTVYKKQVLTDSTRMAYLKWVHDNEHSTLYFRYPHWKVWIHTIDPSWNPAVLYKLGGNKSDWMIPLEQNEK